MKELYQQAINQTLAKSIKFMSAGVDRREDPCEIVFRLPWDDLEVLEICIDIEERLHIKLADDELNDALDGTLGDFVDLIARKFNERG